MNINEVIQKHGMAWREGSANHTKIGTISPLILQLELNFLVLGRRCNRYIASWAQRTPTRTFARIWAYTSQLLPLGPCSYSSDNLSRGD